MNRLKYRGRVAVLALCVTAAGCSTEFPVTPEPAPIPINELHFTGTLTVNGGITRTFSSTRSGPVDLTVDALTDSTGPAVIGPAGTIRIGLQLGSWNGATCAIPTFNNDNAFVSSVVSAAVTGATVLCARVYDAGKLTEPVDFDLKMTFP